MLVKIANWKIAIVGLLFVCLLASLGCWQLIRGLKKQALLKQYATQLQAPPISTQEIPHNQKALRFKRLQLVGKFDNEHTILLDNKTYKGQVGYEVYTPFKAIGLSQMILVDRGFVPMNADRKILPVIPPVQGKVTIMGLANLAPSYFSLGAMIEERVKWPLRIEFIHLTQLENIFEHPLFPYILQLDPKNAAAFTLEWQIVTLSPERHWGYAFQWFALAATLLILLLVLNYQNTRSEAGP